MTKILQIGTKGQLGWELLRTCAPLGEVIALDYPTVDLSDSAGLRELVRSTKPDIIINAALALRQQGCKNIEQVIKDRIAWRLTHKD